MLPGALLALAAWSCLPEEKTPGSDGQEEVIEFDASVLVVGEDLSPLPDATYTVHASASGTSSAQTVDTGGRFRLSGLTGPVLVIIEAPGFLPEPLVVDSGASRTPVRVRMLKETGSTRRRIVMHFAGDVMLGRRYLEPTSEVSAVVTPGDGGASARRVVDSIAPLFTAADVRSLNLETVIGTFPLGSAYPKKRFLLQSPPEIVSLLRELDVSFVTLGNNHLRDWLDDGVDSTIEVLDAALPMRVPYVGAGMMPEEAREPLLIAAAGYKIGILSYTTVNGDFVNDSLPLNNATPPNPLPASEAWQYDFRTFAHALIPDASRRVGEVWLSFKEAEESGATETEIADLWGKLVEVYPELQDWVARRGHGGANPYDFSQIDEEIDSLRVDGADLVVVQFHGGFQFFEVKSEALQAAAYRAIDNGADLVVCHHPHVLQGFEWFQGKLIAYSLGNFVFDQDFLSTFPSAVLRVVFEDQVLIEARVYPIVLENYRPVPLGGTAALTVIQALHERSVLPLRSERIEGAVRNMLQFAAPDPDSRPARIIVERNTGLIEEGSAPVESISLSAGPGAILDLVPPFLTRSRGPGGAILGNILLGRDLFHWGTFEDDTADGAARGGTHWLTNNTFKRIHSLPEAPSGVRCLRIRRTGDNTTRARLRPVARIPMTQHRVYEDEDEDGHAMSADGNASYTLRMWARLQGTGTPHVQFDLYHFDDTNPTEDPESIALGVEEVIVRIPDDDEWHEVAINLPQDFLAGEPGLEPNAVLLYVGLDPPDSGESIFLVDNLQLIEWRDADSLPDAFYAMDALRWSNNGSAFTVDIERTAP